VNVGPESLCRECRKPLGAERACLVAGLVNVKNGRLHVIDVRLPADVTVYVAHGRCCKVVKHGHFVTKPSPEDLKRAEG
jgi:hypothetical protein